MRPDQNILCGQYLNPDDSDLATHKPLPLFNITPGIPCMLCCRIQFTYLGMAIRSEINLLLARLQQIALWSSFGMANEVRY
jgi:hypothetical protein